MSRSICRSLAIASLISGSSYSGNSRAFLEIVPKNFIVDAVVPVRQPIPHANNLVPGNLRVLGTNIKVVANNGPKKAELFNTPGTAKRREFFAVYRYGQLRGCHPPTLRVALRRAKLR
jgi:hypothetical protein